MEAIYLPYSISNTRLPGTELFPHTFPRTGVVFLNYGSNDFQKGYYYVIRSTIHRVDCAYASERLRRIQPRIREVYESY